jgi:hypothetical protein
MPSAKEMTEHSNSRHGRKEYLIMVERNDTCLLHAFILSLWDPEAVTIWKKVSVPKKQQATLA